MRSRLIFFAGLFYYAINWLWQQSWKVEKRGNQARGQGGRLDSHCESRAAPLSKTRGRRPPAQNENKDPILIYIGLWVGCLFGVRRVAVCFLWLSLPGDCGVTDEALLAETT